MTTMPQQKPGKSESTVGTPWEFIKAAERVFGKFAVDLAALPENAKAPLCITPEMDSLAQDWNELEGNLWLNPPYSDIAPWVEKCAKYRSKGKIFVLVPASLSTNWFANHVWGKARILAVQGRVKFQGHKHQFPKDLMLLVYNADEKGLAVWNWRRS